MICIPAVRLRRPKGRCATTRRYQGGEAVGTISQNGGLRVRLQGKVGDPVHAPRLLLQHEVPGADRGDTGQSERGQERREAHQSSAPQRTKRWVAPRPTRQDVTSMPGSRTRVISVR